MSRGVPRDEPSRPRGARGGAGVAVCAPNALKGTLSALRAAEALAAGVEDVGWRAARVPVADGGDGTLDVVLATRGGRGRVAAVVVTGPLGGRRVARLGWATPTTAVVEMAEACGLRLLAAGRTAPLRATSRGVGDLIAAALDGGARRILVGVGGSASTDGGAGLLSALGARLVDSRGRAVAPGGGGLADTAAVDLSGVDRRVWRCRIDVAVDVDNPLTGPDGAAAVYGPQKGASPTQVSTLERGLGHFATLAERAAGVAGLAEMPGAGAAGGCGFALALLGAHLVGGAALVCDEVGVDRALEGADLVITAEGRLDAQTARGKAPAEMLARAHARGIACVAVCGVRGPGPLGDYDDVIVLGELGPAPRRHPRALLRRAAALAVTRHSAAPVLTRRPG